MGEENDEDLRSTIPNMDLGGANSDPHDLLRTLEMDSSEVEIDRRSGIATKPHAIPPALIKKTLPTEPTRKAINFGTTAFEFVTTVDDEKRVALSAEAVGKIAPGDRVRVLIQIIDDDD